MKIYFKIIFIYLLIFTLSGCGGSNENELKDLETVTVSLQPNIRTLYFSGTIAPLMTVAVNSPVDGTVLQKNFEYGTEIEKGQLLLVIKSAQLADDYQSAVTTYLKAKKDYLNNQMQLYGNEYLKKLGMISENDYISSTSTNYDLELGYKEAARKLQIILNKMGAPLSDLLSIHIEDRAAVQKALAQPADILKITAPGSGISLMPNKSGGSEESGPLTIGSQVKAAQVLLGIGDSSGISIIIKANEVNVNSIQDGQAATITGDAFPTITLHGKVQQIVQQATSGESGGTPTFPINIVVPHLTDAQRKIIHMGMSAKVALQIQSKPAIRIPIDAVFIDKGVSLVKVLDEKNSKILTVPVVTGPTTLDSVEIQQGLKPGDKVIINANPNRTS